VEFELVRLIAMHGHYGIIGAYQRAGGAANTGMGRVCKLTDAVIDLKNIGRLLGCQNVCFHYALAENRWLNGPNRADSRAAAAQGAALAAPMHLPKEILDA
jgi:hypothetical protein